MFIHLKRVAIDGPRTLSTHENQEAARLQALNDVYLGGVTPK